MLELASRLVPLSILNVNRRRNEAGSVVLPPAPDHRIVVHASIATWTTCRDTGTRHLRRNGDIDIVPAGEEGGYDAAAACESLEVRLSPSLLEHVADEMGKGSAQRGLEMRHVMRDDRIVHLVNALDADNRAGGLGGSLYSEGIGIALAARLTGLSKREAKLRRGLSPAQLQRLFDFIDAHLDQPLTIEVLAREAGASSSHLRHWFKVMTGTTLHQYVMRRRVDRARFMLLESSGTASEIALDCGFAHQSHMALWMRRELGYTPRDLS